MAEYQFKNPLAMAFGVWLQRRRYGARAEEQAARLGLSLSSLRMLESGAAILQPGTVLPLIAEFQDVTFDRACKLVVATQAVQYRSLDAEGFHRRMRELAEADADLHGLLDPFLRLPQGTWSGNASNDATGALYQWVDQFLTGKVQSSGRVQPEPERTSYESALEERIRDLLDATSPLYTDSAVQLLERLRMLTPLTTPANIVRWEHEQKAEIVGVIGVVQHITEVSPLTMELDAHYQYLWNGDFDRLRIICLNQDKNPESLFYKDLHRYLARSLHHQHRAKDLTEKMAKVRIHIAGETGSPLLAMILKRHIGGITREMLHCWYFRLRNGGVVGFTDDISMGPSQISGGGFALCLSRKEVRQDMAHLEAYWSMIYDEA